MSFTVSGQGTGRHSQEEIWEFRDEVLEALNTTLEASEKKAGRRKEVWLLGGEKPTEADASVYGCLASVLVAPASAESAKAVRNFPALVRYAGRIHDEYFPERERWED